jgi:sulfate adenylyltransferase
MITTLQAQGSSRSPDHLNPPYGGELVNLMVSAARAAELQAESREWPSWDLIPRQFCDLELLLNGGFSPLRGFMSRADYESTCSRMRLADGRIWPVPIVLDVPDEFARTVGPGRSVALRDPEGVMLAALHVDELWQPDPRGETLAIDGAPIQSQSNTRDRREQTNPWYVSGRLEGIQRPSHYDFRALRLAPSELRAEFVRLGWRRIVGFHTTRPMHRAHHELTLRAAKQVEANLLIHPSVGMTKSGETEYYVRVRCYEALLSKYPKDTVKLSLLPLARRMGGPREAILHAIVRKNFGCSHFILDRAASVAPADGNGKSASNPQAAHEFLSNHQKEIGIAIVPFQMMVYLEDKDAYVPEDQVPAGSRVLTISETELRARLSGGREIPSWFTFPEVARELRRKDPPRQAQGFTVFFTGLSGSGKSTIANILLIKFLEMGGRPVTLLDGDVVRKHLSSELGFSREHRDINIRRIGFVASEITKNGGIAICAPIAPYDEVRKQVRDMIQPHGGFILVHLATALEVCEKRDRKGLYAKARAGIVKHFTGISDPYEAPIDADVNLDTSDLTPEEAAQEIFLHLEREGFIGASS